MLLCYLNSSMLIDMHTQASLKTYSLTLAQAKQANPMKIRNFYGTQIIRILFFARRSAGVHHQHPVRGRDPGVQGAGDGQQGEEQERLQRHRERPQEPGGRRDQGAEQAHQGRQGGAAPGAQGEGGRARG